MTRKVVPSALGALLLASASVVEGATVTVGWDPSAGATSYTVLVGTASGTYTMQYGAGAQTTYTVTGLLDDQLYYFGVRAQGPGGVSAVSQISYRTPPTLAPGSAPTRSDFNADGLSDLLWQYAPSGDVAVWHMNGASVVLTRYLGHQPGDPTWKVAGSGDFNGDGKPDLLWRNSSTGQLGVWLLDGVTMYATPALSIGGVSDLNWEVASVADLDGDGKPDIVWRNTKTGELAAWFVQGTQVTLTNYLSIRSVPDTNWRIAGAAHVNADPYADLIWQNVQTGDLAVWYMQGTTVIGTNYLVPSRVSDPAWRIASVTDNPDASVTLVWRHSVTGDLASWKLNDNVATAMQYLTPSRVADLAWMVVGPR